MPSGGIEEAPFRYPKEVYDGDQPLHSSRVQALAAQVAQTRSIGSRSPMLDARFIPIISPDTTENRITPRSVQAACARLGVAEKDEAAGYQRYRPISQPPWDKTQGPTWRGSTNHATLGTGRPYPTKTGSPRGSFALLLGFTAHDFC